MQESSWKRLCLAAGVVACLDSLSTAALAQASGDGPKPLSAFQFELSPGFAIPLGEARDAYRYRLGFGVGGAARLFETPLFLDLGLGLYPITDITNPETLSGRSVCTSSGGGSGCRPDVEAVWTFPMWLGTMIHLPLGSGDTAVQPGVAASYCVYDPHLKAGVDDGTRSGLGYRASLRLLLGAFGVSGEFSHIFASGGSIGERVHGSTSDLWIGLNLELVPKHGAGQDRDGDGVREPHDRCPEDSEDVDSFQDDDGCPDSDNDNDGVSDERDRCPNQPAKASGPVTAVCDASGKCANPPQDGCPH